MADGPDDLVLLELCFEELDDLFVAALLDEVVELLDELVDLSLPDAVHDLGGLLEAFAVLQVGAVLVLGDLVVDVLHLFQNAVGEPDVLSGVLEHSLADAPEVVLGVDFRENVADHQLDALGDEVEIVVLVQFVPAVEDVVNALHVLRRVADLRLETAPLPRLHDPRLVHQQVVVDVDVFGAQVEGVPPEVVQLVHVDPVLLVANQLKLPVPHPVFLPADQSPYPPHLLRL